MLTDRLRGWRAGFNQQGSDMARRLVDFQPVCGHPWILGLATEPHELEMTFRLRYDVFFREFGYSCPATVAQSGLDRDEFDDWCDHIILYDTQQQEVIGCYRAIPGSKAIAHGGFYGEYEFDMSALHPIADRILQGGRTCVAAPHRNGPAIQYLSYGMELLLREYQAEWFLGAESFRTTSPDSIHRIYSYLLEFGSDPDYHTPPRPGFAVEDLIRVPVTQDELQSLPGVIRMDLKMGFLACSPPAWDAGFGSYDVLMLGKRDRLTRSYHQFISRIERNFRP